jgi:hypothetical protein
MTSRLASRIEKAEKVVRSRPLHLIVCKVAAEVGEAERSGTDSVTWFSSPLASGEASTRPSAMRSGFDKPRETRADRALSGVRADGRARPDNRHTLPPRIIVNTLNW